MDEKTKGQGKLYEFIAGQRQDPAFRSTVPIQHGADKHTGCGSKGHGRSFGGDGSGVLLRHQSG